MTRFDADSFMVPSLAWRSAVSPDSGLLMQVVCGDGKDMARGQIGKLD